MKLYSEPSEILTVPVPAEGTVSGTGVQIGSLFGVATTTNTAIEMVVNGRFSADASWAKGTGWTIAAGVATSDASQLADADLSQTNANVLNSEFYLTRMTITRTAGNVTMVVGGTEGTDRALTGTYTEIIRAGAGGTIIIRADLDFAGTVDLVSVVPVESITQNGAFGSDTLWTKGTGWTIAAGVATSDASQAATSLLEQGTNGIDPTTGYWTQFKVTARTAGSVAVNVGGTAGTARSTTGTFTEYLLTAGTDIVALAADLDFAGSVDDFYIVKAHPGNAVAIAVKGVVDLAKPSTLVIAVGDKLWFDPNARQVNKTATVQLPVGIAVEAAGNPSATVKTLLKPIPAVAA